MIPRHIEVIYCDDIRQEVGNKLSFIGVYSADLIAQSFPTILPKLCIHVSVMTPAEEPFEKLSVQIDQDETTILETGDIFSEASEHPLPVSITNDRSSHTDSPAKYIGYNFIFALSPFSIEKPTKLRVHATTEKMPLRSRALRIRLAETSSN